MTPGLVMEPEVEGTVESYNYVNGNWKLELSGVVLNTGHRCFKLDRVKMLLVMEK
jgi:hypothetical protein